jgi:hypothetical protein
MVMGAFMGRGFAGMAAPSRDESFLALFYKKEPLHFLITGTP